MQRYLNELYLACKEQNHNCHSCKICTIFNFLKIHWKRTEKSHSHGPFLFSSLKESKGAHNPGTHCGKDSAVSQCPSGEP